MIHFLVDSSAVWRLQRQPELTEVWEPSLRRGAIGSCEPQRAEFRRSVRNADEFDEMDQMFRDVYPDVPVPKSVWRWIDSAQHRLAVAGAVRALSVVDQGCFERRSASELPSPPSRRICTAATATITAAVTRCTIASVTLLGNVNTYAT